MGVDGDREMGEQAQEGFLYSEIHGCHPPQSFDSLSHWTKPQSSNFTSETSSNTGARSVSKHPKRNVIAGTWSRTFDVDWDRAKLILAVLS